MKDSKVYLNIRTPQGVETVDEFRREENQSPKEFRLYVRQMIEEYRIAGMYVYKSSRPSKQW
jgi:hypothetical protein